MRVEASSRCAGCMEPCTGDVCLSCGWVQDTQPASPVFLRPGTKLRGEYLLGRVLGSGGFGITYLAWDCNLDCKVAIKEYFPTAFGSRAHDRQTVVVNNPENKNEFEHGLEKFLAEGRALAKFKGHPGIASVLSFFRENGTSYLVLEYEDGVTLLNYVSQQPNGRLEYKRALEIALPVMDTLREVHKANILHRDISPDNIVINTSGQVKLLDFGSAKHQIASQIQSQLLTLKRGYSPEEQYRSTGEQGFWTDVYALGATLYFSITGLRPPDALDRLAHDTLLPPSKLGVQIPRNMESALMKALEVRSPGRFQTIGAFQQALVGGPKPPDHKPEEKDRRKTNSLSYRRTAVWLAGALLAVLGLIILSFRVLAVPEISQFTIEPPRITSGQAATVQWSVKGGRVTISPGLGDQTSTSSRQVTPVATTTYILTARGLLRSVSRSATVVVAPTQFPVVFKVEPSNITAGQAADLIWDVSGSPKSVSIEPGIGKVENSGRHTVSPDATTTYTLKTTAFDGTTVDSSTVITVGPTIAKPFISLTADQTTVKAGQSTTLSWKVEGDSPTVWLDNVPVKVEDRREISPAVTTTYKLVARNSGGATVKTVTVTVAIEPPTIVAFTAEPARILSGQNSTLRWSINGQVDSVLLDGFGQVNPTGTKVVSPSGTTTYLLTARGQGGSSSQPVTVTVEVPVPKTPPAISLFSVSPSVINAGDSVLVRWSVSGDTNQISIEPGIGAVHATGSVTVNPTKDTTYTITAQGPAGAAALSHSVQISSEPFSIVKFAAKHTKIKHGQTTQLSWFVTGPVTAISISPEIGVIKTKEGKVDVQPSQDITYSLTAQAGSRTLTAAVKIRVK